MITDSVRRALTAQRRRADVAVYEEVKHRLLTTGARLVHLSTSFRGLPLLQSFVNSAFAPVMAAEPDGSQAAYVPLGHWRPDVADRPTIVALPVPRPYSDWGRIVGWRIEESLPDAVGAFISWLTIRAGSRPLTGPHSGTRGERDSVCC